LNRLRLLQSVAVRFRGGNRAVPLYGPQFVASFTKKLYRLLGIRLFSSTAWHPQMDGQTECVNQELDQFLCLFVNERQNDWYDLLPITEFQHNNYVHSATVMRAPERKEFPMHSHI